MAGIPDGMDDAGPGRSFAMPNIPHYLLISEARSSETPARWRFELRPLSGGESLEATDAEFEARGERLELLAVVRGLEALPQPSRVTLQTPSQYVRRGIAYGLEEWRASGWTWEHFGQMVLVKNHDLWQRLDRALRIHQVECRQWRFDPAHRFGDGGLAQPARLPSRPPRRGLAGLVAGWFGRSRPGAAAAALRATAVGATAVSAVRSADREQELAGTRPAATELAGTRPAATELAGTRPAAARRRRPAVPIVRTRRRAGALAVGATQTVWA